MRRVLLFVSVAMALLPQAAFATDCTRADALAAFDLDSARGEYVSLLALPTPPACARTGFDAVAAKRRRVADLIVQARDAESLGDTTRAHDLVAAVLQLDPANKPVRDVIATATAPSTPSPTPFAGAKSLYAAGYHDEARAEARKVAAEKGLTIDDPNLRSPHASLVTRAADLLSEHNAILIALAVAVSALVVKGFRRVARKRNVTLGTFAAWSDDKTDAGSALKDVVAEQFADVARTTASLRRVDAAAVDLPSPIEIPDSLKVVGPLVQALFRRSILTVSATARRDDPDGPWRITAQLAGRHRSYKQESFKVDTTAGDGLRPVGVFVAAWGMYQVHAHTGLMFRRRTWPFGTDDWKSLAWTRLGTDPSTTDTVAVEHLHRALERDHHNVVALAALGQRQVDSSPADSSEFAAGLSHLRLAHTGLRHRPTVRPRLGLARSSLSRLEIEPLWFQIQYARSTAYLHRYYTQRLTRAADTRDLTEGTSVALVLARGIADTWRSTRRWTLTGRAIPGDRRRELRDVLDHDDLYQLQVLAGALVAEESERLTPQRGEPSSGARALWRWVGTLGDHPTPDQKSLLLHAVTQSDGHDDVRTLYNRACVWAQARYPDEAIASLRECFDHAVAPLFDEVMRWIVEDPTLASVRPRPAFVNLLNELEARRPPKRSAPHPTPGVEDRWQITVAR